MCNVAGTPRLQTGSENTHGERLRCFVDDALIVVTPSATWRGRSRPVPSSVGDVFGGVGGAAFSVAGPMKGPADASPVSFEITWIVITPTTCKGRALGQRQRAADFVEKLRKLAASKIPPDLMKSRTRFIDFHLVAPRVMTVEQSHAICDRLEAALQEVLDEVIVTIHVDPDHMAEKKGVVAA